jgi:hypothetical protein
VSRVETFVLGACLCAGVGAVIACWWQHRKLKRKLAWFREREIARNTCWKCKCSLSVPEEDRGPIHCEDCFISDDDIWDWQDEIDSQAKHL